ncbi:hypothetical protein DXG01_006098 [Tephrocybe rancida]|nr:hypothetical protein DXG01_006098 [Tephrocybe rancida]
MARSSIHGSVSPEDEIRALQALRNANNSTLQEAAATASFTIPVILDRFYNQNNPKDGNISYICSDIWAPPIAHTRFCKDGILAEQMDVIDLFFKDTGLSFSLRKIVWRPVPYKTLHGVDKGNTAETYIKRYQECNVTVLSVYIVGYVYLSGKMLIFLMAGGTLLGYSSFPCEYVSIPHKDGIVLNCQTLPHISSNTDPNSGKTLIHETGHWLGLFHDFQGSCRGVEVKGTTPLTLFVS